MKKLAAGYFLSAFNSLSLSPLGLILIYPALFTYPVSIVLRGFGWRGVRHRLGGIGVAYVGIWSLGAVTYGFVLVSLAGEVSELLSAAAVCWSLYSVLEAVLYIKAARNLDVSLFYISPVSLVGVASFDFILFGGRMDGLRQGQTPQELYLGVAALFFSALASAIASLQVKQYGHLPTIPRPAQLPPSRQEASTQPAFQRKAVYGKPLLTVEVVRRSSGVVCRSCRAVNPADAYECWSCGMRFAKAETGLRCPVCRAPFSLARRVEARRYLCGQCASTLYLRGG
ncbi:MAG: hypothetical protein QXR26_01600 [Candidatus Caldarchaeum sp.]